MNNIAGLVTLLEQSEKELHINTNDGSVIIDSRSFNFTYIGKFGSSVLSHATRLNVVNTLPEKLMVLAAHMNEYSKKIGGITTVTL